MTRGAALFLRSVLVLIGIGAVVLLLWEPHIEGRNAHATLYAIYFNDPFLVYAYIASIPFFVGLYQACRLLEHAGTNNQYSPSAARCLRTIKYCAIATVGFVAVGEALIMLGDSDDRTGGFFVGFLITCVSIAVATTMTVLERAWQRSVSAQSGQQSG